MTAAENPLSVIFPETSHVYVAVTGCNCIIDGMHGYVTCFHKEGRHLVGAFVHCPIKDGKGPMLYVELGKITGERGEHREVTSYRVIGREEFDRLNTLDQLRRDLGWR
jgi:hypothetical protein